MDTVDSALIIVEDPKNMSEANFTPNTFDNAVANLNSSLVYPQNILDVANSTLGQPETTTPILENMYKVVKATVTIYDHV